MRVPGGCNATTSAVKDDVNEAAALPEIAASRKRGRGRPPGAKNKKTLASLQAQLKNRQIKMLEKEEEGSQHILMVHSGFETNNDLLGDESNNLRKNLFSELRK